MLNPNPYESPNAGNSAEEGAVPGVNVYKWEGHTVSITAELIPKFLPLLGQFWISIDGGTPFTSRRLRWHERIEFVIKDNGREIPAMLKSYSMGFGRQPFRLLVNGEVVVDSIVNVQRGRIGFLIGILIGMAIPPALGLVIIIFLKMVG